MCVSPVHTHFCAGEVCKRPEEPAFQAAWCTRVCHPTRRSAVFGGRGPPVCVLGLGSRAHLLTCYLNRKCSQHPASLSRSVTFLNHVTDVRTPHSQHSHKEQASSSCPLGFPFVIWWLWGPSLFLWTLPSGLALCLAASASRGHLPGPGAHCH